MLALDQTTGKRSAGALVGGFTSKERAQLNSASVLIAGLGNIGSNLAWLLARAGIGFLRLVDRDRLEHKNLRNQCFESVANVSRFKAELLAAQLAAALPNVRIDAVCADLEDVPLGLFADIDVCLGALDSLRARQLLLNERAWPLGLDAIDGGVAADGEWLGRVHFFPAGGACCECSWNKAHYRYLALETPCDPHSEATAPPTHAPALIGAQVASVMAAKCILRLLGRGPAGSIEISCDLERYRWHVSRLVRSPNCRFNHEVVTERVTLPVGFASAKGTDVLVTLRERCGNEAVSLELTRRVRHDGVYAEGRWLDTALFDRRGKEPLSSLGLVPNDWIRVRSSRGAFYLVLGPTAGDTTSASESRRLP